MLLKAAGGAYIVWLGIQALRHAGAWIGTDGRGHESQRRLFAKGLFANAINPKVVLFFLSFLPRSVDTSHGNVKWHLGILGVVFTAQAAILFGLIGLFSGGLGAWLNRKPTAGRWLDRVAGGLCSLRWGFECTHPVECCSRYLEQARSPIGLSSGPARGRASRSGSIIVADLVTNWVSICSAIPR